MDDDLIRRQDAIHCDITVIGRQNAELVAQTIGRFVDRIKALPSVQPESKPINYRDCANSMLKMWMDNVVTDGEYYRIMDKLYKHETEMLSRGE